MQTEEFNLLELTSTAFRLLPHSEFQLLKRIQTFLCAENFLIDNEKNKGTFFKLEKSSAKGDVNWNEKELVFV